MFTRPAVFLPLIESPWFSGHLLSIHHLLERGFPDSLTAAHEPVSFSNEGSLADVATVLWLRLQGLKDHGFHDDDLGLLRTQTSHLVATREQAKMSPESPSAPPGTVMSETQRDFFAGLMTEPGVEKYLSGKQLAIGYHLGRGFYLRPLSPQLPVTVGRIAAETERLGVGLPFFLRHGHIVRLGKVAPFRFEDIAVDARQSPFVGGHRYAEIPPSAPTFLQAWRVAQTHRESVLYHDDSNRQEAPFWIKYYPHLGHLLESTGKAAGIRLTLVTADGRRSCSLETTQETGSALLLRPGDCLQFDHHLPWILPGQPVEGVTHDFSGQPRVIVPMPLHFVREFARTMGTPGEWNKTLPDENQPMATLRIRYDPKKKTFAMEPTVPEERITVLARPYSRFDFYTVGSGSLMLDEAGEFLVQCGAFPPWRFSYEPIVAYFRRHFYIRTEEPNPLFRGDYSRYYAILGIPMKPLPKQEDVKKRYRSLVKECHPDTGSHKDAVRFQNVTEAYEMVIMHNNWKK